MKKKELQKYTLLLPQMLPIHFELISQVLRMEGYDVEVLDTTHRGIIEAGLKHVHNDICFPAMLVIGQMIDALKSGKYDTRKVALCISQTGGGCRASNYIHLLRKGLKKAGYDYVPVISLNLSGLEKQSGLEIGPVLLARLAVCVVYGDALMWLANQCRAYEVCRGETDRMVERWTRLLCDDLKTLVIPRRAKIRARIKELAADFLAIPLKMERKPRVGIVGEIYVKFAPLGNNNLADFLQAEGAEIVVPGLLDFLIFKTDNRVEDSKIYGGKLAKRLAVGALKAYLVSFQRVLQEGIAPYFEPPTSYAELKELVRGYLGYGNKMGEGWLLCAEMLELIHSGVPNIVCTQPFGCLPNHIVGKGMLRPVRENHPNANIVAIDYDPGTSPVNQENRLRLMLAAARKAMSTSS